MKKSFMDLNLISNTIGNFMYSIYPIILIFLINKFLNLESSGEFSNMFYLSAQLGTIASFGGRVPQLANIDDYYSFQDFFISKIVTTFIMVLVSIFFIYISDYSFNTIILLLIFVAFRALESFSDLIYGEYQLKNQLFYVGLFLTLKAISIIILFTFFLYYSSNIYLSSITIVIITCLLMLLEIRKLKPKLSFKGFRLIRIWEILRYQYPIFIIVFLFFLQMSLPRYVLSLVGNNKLAGIFNIIVIPSSFSSLLSIMIFQPRITQLIKLLKMKKYENYLKLVNRIIVQILVSSLFYALVLVIIGIDILSKVSGLDLSIYLKEIISLSFMASFGGIFYFLNYLLSILKEITKQILALVLVSTSSIFLAFVFFNSFSLQISVLFYTLPIVLVSIVFYIIHLNNIKAINN